MLYEWNAGLHNVCLRMFSLLSLIHQHQLSELLVSKSHCHPSLKPGAEERVVAPEAEARESLITPLPNTKTLLLMAHSQCWPDQLWRKVTRPKHPVRIRPRSSLPRLPGSQGQRTQIPAGRDVEHLVRSLSFPHSSLTLSDCTSSFKDHEVYSK